MYTGMKQNEMADKSANCAEHLTANYLRDEGFQPGRVATSLHEGLKHKFWLKSKLHSTTVTVFSFASQQMDYTLPLWFFRCIVIEKYQ